MHRLIMKASLLLLEGEPPDPDLAYYFCQGGDLRKLAVQVCQVRI